MLFCTWPEYTVTHLIFCFSNSSLLFSTSFITLCFITAILIRWIGIFVCEQVNHIFLFAELYIKKHEKLIKYLINQVKKRNIQRMIFELGKKGFKSGTICCQWENVEQSPTPHCHQKGYWCHFSSTTISFIQIRWVLRLRGNVACGAVYKILIE